MSSVHISFKADDDPSVGGNDEQVDKSDNQHIGVSDFLSVWLRGDMTENHRPGQV